MPNPVQDTISFSLVAEKTVVNTTVKLTASISVTMLPGMTETSMKDGIRDMMQSLISETMADDGGKRAVTWQFANLSRSTATSGVEQVDLTATARVHESDNYSLDKRIRDVSKTGMSITDINADTSPPQAMIEAAESELRISLLKKATTELNKINNEMSTGYRLGAVNFQIGTDYVGGSRMAAMTSNSISPKGMMYATDMGGDENSLGNAVKLTLRANIELRHASI